MLLLYSKKNYPNLIRISTKNISSAVYAQSSKILNIEVKYIKERLRNVYVIEEVNVLELLANAPFATHIDSSVLLWEENSPKFVLNISLGWEALNIIMALSGDLTLASYKRMLKKNLQVKQDMMYLTVQLQEISARIHEYNSRQSSDYFDKLLFQQMLKRKKIKSKIIDGRVVMTLPDVKVGNPVEGYIVYNNIHLYISQPNVIDGYRLDFNNFSFSSFWDIKDVVLHPNLFVPYYVDMPIVELSYEDYIDHIVAVAKDNHNEGVKYMTPLIRSFNRYRRIWAGMRDPRVVEDATEEDLMSIFIEK